MCGPQDTTQHSAFTCLTQRSCFSMWLCTRVRGTMVCLGTQIHLMQKIQLSLLMAPARGKMHCNRLQLTTICLSEQIPSPGLEKSREGSCICLWFVWFFLKGRRTTLKYRCYRRCWNKVSGLETPSESLSIIFYSIGLTCHCSPKESFFFRDVTLHSPGLRS